MTFNSDSFFYRTVWGLLLAATLLASSNSMAQTYPARPVTIINPYPPGGLTDVVLRVVAQEISTDLGQPVLVDSKPGGGATISASYVARSAPDGYTLLASSSQHAISPWLMKNLPYNFMSSFTPVTMLGESYIILVVRPGLNVDTVAQLVELIKSKGSTMNFGSSGPGGLLHLAGVMLNNATGAKVTHVPYQGTAPALAALLAGQIDYLFGDPTVLQSVQAGKIKALAVATETRIAQLPNVPAMRETFPGFTVVGWFGLDAPAGTPRPVIDRINASVQKAIRSPAVIQRLTELSTTPRAMGPEEFGAFRANEFRKYEQLVKDAGLKME